MIRGIKTYIENLHKRVKMSDYLTVDKIESKLNVVVRNYKEDKEGYQPIKLSGKRKRKACECNSVEMIVAVVVADRTIKTSDELTEYMRLNTLPLNLLCDEKPRNEYIKNVLSMKSDAIQEYISNIQTLLTENPEIPYLNISVYLTGKTITFPGIKNINKGLDTKMCKGDVYIKYQTESGLDEWISISVKQSPSAPKSNYSVEKLIPNKEESAELTRIKIKMLDDNGFNIHNKSDRPNMNKLFYDNKNPYFEAIRKSIETHKDYIKKTIVDCIYSRGVPYPVWEYNGKTMEQLNKHIGEIHDAIFEEHLPFYMTSKGESRNCAKMFYLLKTPINSYRVELRWKGEIRTASPQFLVYAI